MVPIPIQTDALKMVGDWISSLAGHEERKKKEERQQIQDALQALMEAVTTTRAYLAETRDHPEKQSDDKQKEITQKWLNAGYKIMPIDQVSASGALLKGDYWADPKGWVAAGKDEYIVNLDRIRDEGLKALGVNSSAHG